MSAVAWRFGEGQTAKQERAEIARAQRDGRAEEYIAAPAVIAVETLTFCPCGAIVWEALCGSCGRSRKPEPKPSRPKRPARAPAPRSEPVPLPVLTGGHERGSDGYLADHLRGLLEPVPIALPADLPAWTQRVAEFVALVIGLRLTVGETRPAPFGSRWVAERCGCSLPTANRALRALRDVGFLSAHDPMPGRHGRTGTAVYGIPGHTVETGSDRMPVPSFEPGPIPVEAQDIEAPRPVEPTPVAPDEPSVRDAERGGSAGNLDGTPATGSGAEVGMVTVTVVGHAIERYAQRPTPTILLERANRLDLHPRDAVLWLACQLRDHGHDDDSPVLDLAAERGVGQRDAQRIVRSAHRRPPRPPWPCTSERSDTEADR